MPQRPGLSGLLPALIRTLPSALAALAAAPAPMAAQGVFTQTASPMASPRHHFTATPLPNGRVLIIGGSSDTIPPYVPDSDFHLPSGSEVYDPILRTFSASGKLISPRTEHTATPLPDGSVLVTGGLGANWAEIPTGSVFSSSYAQETLASAEVYSPGAGTFSATATPMQSSRHGHTATLLPNGKVLILGGTYHSYDTVLVGPCEEYDPATRAFARVGFIQGGITGHTATLLPNGKILVAGGMWRDATGALAPNLGMVYDPSTWQCTRLTTGRGQARSGHTATLLPDGTVLVSGGGTASTELFDPATETFIPAPGLNRARRGHTATRLPSGAVMIAGGWSTVPGTSQTASVQDAEYYLPWRRAFAASTGFMNLGRAHHVACPLPNGQVLMVGGTAVYGVPTATAEVYDPQDPAPGQFSPTGSLADGTYLAGTTLLANGKILVSGGLGAAPASSASLYDALTGTFTPAGSMGYARYKHTTTVLPGGLVLVAGGQGDPGADSALELYDAKYNWFFPAGTLKVGRREHTTTLLPNGKVLVVGGVNGSTLATAELYDPATRTSSYTGSLGTPRARHTATLLPNGKVLVVGGRNTADLATAEVYDLQTGRFTPLASRALWVERDSHTATLLWDGRVLVAGGMNASSPALPTLEVIDPSGQRPTEVAAMGTARVAHSATLLPSGKVLIAGGMAGSALSAPIASSELFDPFTGTVAPSGTLGTARRSHAAILLPTGRVLVVGGYNGAALGTAEVYH